MPLLKDAVCNEIEKRELSFKEVERLCNVSVQMIMDVIAGKTPSEPIIQKFCNGLNIDRDEIITDPLNMSIREAAIMSGKSNDFVRMAIEQKRMPGACVISPDTGIRTYHIPRKAFEAYMGLSQSFNLDMLADLLANEISKRLGLVE